MSERTPAEAFPPGEFLQDELDARGWTVTDLVTKIGGDERQQAVNEFAILLLLICPTDPDLTMGDDLASDLARALGGSPDYWSNLDSGWRAWNRTRHPREIGR